jgi:hypothetical protein
MMKRKLITAILFLTACSGILAQVDKPATKVSLEGQIALTTNIDALFINLGGPTLRINFAKFSIGGSFLPSLKIENKASKLLATPVLGIGPQVCFLKDKRFILEFPCYYIASKAEWTLSMGVGYVLTKPKRQ